MKIQEAKELDIVDYLSGLNITPARIWGDSYWYLSPLRQEKTPSFKVNRKINRWYDFAEGKGGNLVDFGTIYHQCDVKGFLQILRTHTSLPVQHNKIKKTESPVELQNNQVKIVSAGNIKSYALQKYLSSRRILPAVAEQYLNEVHYQICDHHYYALGFKNDAGGYELRNEYVKLSSSPKAITFMQNGSTDLAVFEGFFNFLSYKNMYYKQEEPLRNFLVLNSASFFEKSLSKMQEHNRVYLYLDNDNTGQKCTQKALELDREKFTDERNLYRQYDDLNDWLKNIGNALKQPLRQKP